MTQKEKIFNLDGSNKKAFFQKLRLEKIEETIINIDDEFSNNEIQDIIIEWISIGDKDNRYTDDIPSSQSIIQGKKLIINNNEILKFSRNFIGNNEVSTLTNITFTEGIHFPNSGLSMNNCTVEGDIMFASFKNRDIKLQTTIVKGCITGDSEYSEGIINHGTLGKIDLDSCKIDNVLDISDLELYDISIVNTEIKGINISDTKIHSLSIKGSTIEEIKVEKSEIKEISVIESVNSETCIDLIELHELEKLVINGNYLLYSPISRITLNNVFCFEKERGLYLFHNLRIIDSFIYEGYNLIPRLSFSRILFNKLYLKEIDLNKSIFNFINITEFYISGVNLSECVFNSITFPKNNKLLSQFNKEDITEILLPEDLKDNYRQLKHAMDKNGNHTEANKFFVKEMEYHGKGLYWNENKFEKIIFDFQKTISNFGNSWIRPLLILLGIILLKTLIDIWHIDHKIDYIFGFKNFFYFLWDFIANFSNLYSKNLLVFHEIYTPEKVTFINTVLNIFTVILIYHIVVAFKRSTKR